MKKTLNCVAFDIGGSRGRCMLGKYDGKSINLELSYEFNTISTNLRGTYFWDVLQQFESIKNGLKKVSHNVNAQVASMGIDTMGCNFALLDKNGNLIGAPLYTRIPQKKEVMAHVFEKIPAEDIFAITGLQVSKLNTLYHLAELQMQKSPQLDIAHKLLMIPDLYNYWLSGEAVSEYTIASTTHLIDAKRRDWSYDLIKKNEIDPNLFPQIVNTGTILGGFYQDIVDETGLKDTKVIANALHDTASALLSLGNKRKNNLFVSLGTWAILGSELKEPILTKEAMHAGFANEGAAYKNIRIVYNSLGTGILRQCKEIWEIEEKRTISFEELIAKGQKTKSLSTFMNPRYEEFLVTNNMVKSIQNYCINTGQRVPETKGEFVRTIAESLAMSFKAIVERLSVCTNERYDILHIMGGGSRDALICQCAADALNMHVVTGPVEAASAGNIIAQLKAFGELRTQQDIQELVNRSFPRKEYLPKNTEIWDDRLEECKKKKIFN